MHEEDDEAADEEQRRRGTRAAECRPSNDHAKIWIVDGITTIIDAAAKKTSVVVGMPVANMWCAQTPKPMKATSSSAIATSGNAIILRRANVGMIDVAIPNAGSDDDVDLGVAEDPEEVLPEERRRRRARRRRSGSRAFAAARGRRGQVDVSAGSAKSSAERRGEDREAEERHPVERHPGRAQLEDRDDEVDRGDRRRERR